MMETALTRWDGRVFTLPALLSCTLEYTAGVPCDSFALRCLWDRGLEGGLADLVGFTAWEDGQRVFQGVVDECECRFGDSGSTLTVSGRGMAALLLDNEAQAADYQTATAADILRDHVEPYGIQVAGGYRLPPVEGFSVASGSSEWQVLYDFARYHGGVAPRFDRQGRLVLSPWQDGERLVIDDKTAVTELVCREKRYGVLSEILVRDKTRQQAERMVNRTFAEQGGRCRRVLTMPGRSGYQAMRYRGEFQLQRSQAERSRLELTVPQRFFAWPGDLVRLDRTGLGCNGIYRVLEAAVELDGQGGRTRLVLGEPESVL